MKSDISLVGVSPDIKAAFHQRDRELDEAHRIAKFGTWSWTRATDVAVWSDEVYRIFVLLAKIRSGAKMMLIQRMMVALAVAFDSGWLFDGCRPDWI